MVEIVFCDQKKHSGKIVVPKKLTKGIYAGGFFHRVLGEGMEHVLTVRHPVASCVSTYEKSGCLPIDGRFVVRSNIEEWCRRDLRVVAFSESALQASAQSYHDRHGSGSRAAKFYVSAKARRLHPKWIERAQPAIAVLAEAHKLGADLIVAGAFGHPRLWEKMMGGVTRDLLARMNLPILMSY